MSAARLTPDERYRRRLAGLNRSHTPAPAKRAPAPSKAAHRDLVGAKLRAEAKANAAVLAATQAGVAAEPWVPGAHPEAQYAEPAAWFD